MKTIRLTAGEAIVRYLDNQYVAIEQDGKLIESKFVELFYAIFGHGCVLGVGEALSGRALNKGYAGQKRAGYGSGCNGIR